MNVELILSSIVKTFGIIFFTYLSEIKLTNNTLEKKQIYIIIFMSWIMAGIYVFIKRYIGSMLSLYIIYVIICYIIKMLHKYKSGYSMIVGAVSIAISLITFVIAIGISFVPHKIFNIESYIINSILIGCIQGGMILAFFRIKKFRKGFDFLKDKNKDEYIDMIMLTISSVILLGYCVFGNYYGDKLTFHIFISMLALTIIMIVIIQKSLKLCYKQNLLKREVEECKKKLKEKDNEIKKLSEERYEISRINHEFYNRQKALEQKVKEMETEASNEIGVIDRIENLTKEYSKSLEDIKGKEKLPLTEISEIDDMFKYMQTECSKNNIEFKLHIEGEIYHLINKIIPKNKLETLIGDHLRNAIIAINSSKNKNKSILVMLGKIEGKYELCIYDSGIEFEIKTLEKLGTERITTHKETGGSGIGFMTTFETLKECKASLVIEEKHKEAESDYTKAIKIKFDGKNEYKIISYRAEKLKKEIKRNKMIIENVKM